MTKKNTTTHETSPEVLDPVSVETTTDQHSISVPPGHVYILALNEDGTEKKGSGFFYPEKTYRRFYSDETKYTVKKKVQ